MPDWIMLKICDSIFSDILCPLFPILLIVDIASRKNMNKGNDLLVKRKSKKVYCKKKTVRVLNVLPSSSSTIFIQFKFCFILATS